MWRPQLGIYFFFPSWPINMAAPGQSRHHHLNTRPPLTLSPHPKWALTLWKTESGLWSRSPLLVTEISAAEHLWVSSAMVLSCEEGDATHSRLFHHHHSAGFTHAHTAAERCGCHLVDTAAADGSRLDQGAAWGRRRDTKTQQNTASEGWQ